MSHSLTIAEVISAMEKRYPSASAEVWDAVGLVVGNPNNSINTVLFSVDPSEAVVAEAIEIGAGLIICHHPLTLNGLTSFAESNFKGRVISQLIKTNTALFTAHTNADVAKDGVSDSLAKSLGMDVDGAIDKTQNLGRIGSLPKPLTLADFSNQLFDTLPKTARGVHVAGNLAGRVQRVAVCGGAGDSLLGLVEQSDADVYVTSDLKYHLAQEFVSSTGKALIDISHWAAEWTWLEPASKLLNEDLGGNLKTHVSKIITDPWTKSLN